MKKKPIDRDLIILLVLTLMTLVTWVGTEAYRTFTKREIPAVLESLLTPLNPVLDSKVLDNLEQRSL